MILIVEKNRSKAWHTKAIIFQLYTSEIENMVPLIIFETQRKYYYRNYSCVKYTNFMWKTMGLLILDSVLFPFLSKRLIVPADGFILFDRINHFLFDRLASDHRVGGLRFTPLPKFWIVIVGFSSSSPANTDIQIEVLFKSPIKPLTNCHMLVFEPNICGQLKQPTSLVNC